MGVEFCKIYTVSVFDNRWLFNVKIPTGWDLAGPKRPKTLHNAKAVSNIVGAMALLQAHGVQRESSNLNVP